MGLGDGVGAQSSGLPVGEGVPGGGLVAVGGGAAGV